MSETNRDVLAHAEDAAEGNENAIRNISYAEGYEDGVSAERERWIAYMKQARQESELVERPNGSGHAVLMPYWVMRDPGPNDQRTDAGVRVCRSDA